MQFSRNNCISFALAGAALICAVFLIAAALSARNRPEKLFARLVVAPVPKSVSILDSDIVSGREWRVFFHVQISPKDFPAILAAKRYKRLQEETPAYKAFVETTYQRFRKRLPTETTLAFYEVYEVWSEPEGTVSYLIANPEHSELFAFSARF